MAVELSREGFMQLFTQSRRPNQFLSRFFTIKPGNVFNGDKVAIDIERFGEDVAVAITKCTGPNLNDISQFTTKEFEPPAYGEAVAMDVCELINRMAGVDPYTAAYTDYAGQLVSRMISAYGKINDKIVRAVELQASQVLQTGELTLTDDNGATVYEMDFFPKATHFPTTSNSWSTGASSDPLADLESLADVISANGLVDANIAILGSTALRNLKQNAEVQNQLDNRRFMGSEFAPRFAESGATYQGTLFVGNYQLELWSYPGRYKDPNTGTSTKYIADDKVVMLSTSTRLDMVSARVPLPLGPDPRVASLLPGRLTNVEAGFDVTPNLYASNNGKQIFAELESRPLCVPVQIDGFGCLDTET